MSAPVAPDAEGLPFTPGVVAASPYGDPTALLKACEVGCAIVVGCAQVLEAAGEEIPWVEAPESKAKSMLAKGGKSKGRGASRARPRRLPGHHFATLSAICQAERERQGEACDALDDDLEESLGLQAGSFPGGRQKGSRYPPAREGFRTSRPSLHGVIARPTAPSASSLKALPAKGVQDFLMAIQENRPEQAQEAFRQVRLAVGNRARSKEAFGGLRAMLHYYLETSANSDNLDQAKSFLDELKASSDARLVSPAAFNAMLRGLLARNNFREAQRLRNEMPRFGLTPNEASLNLLMDTAARSGSQYLDEAWDILEEMQRLNLKADKYTVSILTKHLSDRISDKKRVPRGVAMVEYFLRTQPEDVDEVLVNSLLDVFCKLGDMPRLEATLEKMREYGIKGSAVTYGTIVKAYGRAGNIDRVLQAWEEMQAEGLEANAVTYGCMLDACVKCGHLEKALQIFAIMRQRGLHRNTILYATLIKGFAKSKDPLAAKNLYREMRAERVPCNVVVFNSLIDACVRACDLQGAAEVLQEMTATNVRPDLITFSTLIKGYCSNGELSKAMRLQEELQARQLECDEIVYNSLLEGCVKAGNLQLGLSMFQEMKNKRVRPSPVTFSILVKLLSRAGRLDLAVHLVSKEMRQMYDVPPTRMVWSCLVTCCLKARDLTRAVMALELLDSDCAALGTGRISMYAAVIEGSITSGEVSTALQLVDWAYSRAPPEDARVGLSMDLLKRVFETAGLRGAEAEAQETLDTVGPRIGEHVRGALEDVLMRSKGRLNLDDMGYKGSAKIVSHDQGRAWHWDQSYSSMPRYEEAPLGFGCEAWDGGYWPGADAYSVFPWNQEVAPFQWQSWDGWRAPELNLGPGHPATPMRKDCEYTPATTAGKSSHRSPLEETEDDRLRTPVQKVLFEDCIPELDGPPPGL